LWVVCVGCLWVGCGLFVDLFVGLFFVSHFDTKQQ
jgi:hypothetical protein